jgi:fructuronate reductase
VALWIASIHKRGDLNDPRREEILNAAKQINESDPSAPFFAIPGLFSPQLIDARDWRDRINAELALIV